MGVTLIVGDDDLLLLRATTRVVAECTAADAGIEWQQFDVAEIDGLPEMRTASLFASRCGVVLRGVETVSGDLKGALEEYVADPSPDTDLVLVAKGVQKIQTVKKTVEKTGTLLTVKLPAEWDDRAWDGLVADEFRVHERAFQPGAVAAIRDYAGLSATQIASQVRTVVSSTDASPITETHVHDVLTMLREGSAFAVADAYVARRPADAVLAVRAASRAGVAPLAIVGALVWRTRQLLLARGGATQNDAGVRSAGQWRQLTKDAARFTPGELAWCHDRLAQLDMDLKSVDAADTVVLEIGVVELATSRTVGEPFNPLART